MPRLELRVQGFLVSLAQRVFLAPLAQQLLDEGYAVFESVAEAYFTLLRNEDLLEVKSLSSPVLGDCYTGMTM